MDSPIDWHTETWKIYCVSSQLQDEDGQSGAPGVVNLDS